MFFDCQKVLIALAAFMSLPVFADGTQVIQNTPQPTHSALPAKAPDFWELLAFEVGTGHYYVPNEYVNDHMGLTFGLGRRIGDGAMLLRYSTHTDWNLFNEILVDVGCQVFSVDSCLMKSISYQEYSLIYHERVGYFSLGLGGGVVRRQVEVEDINTTPRKSDVVSTNRAAIFYELMLNLPLNRDNKTSVSFGVQGQYNQDYPSHSVLLLLEKGI